MLTLKQALLLVLLFILGIGACSAGYFGTKYYFRDALRAAKEERALDKYICDKAKGHIYYLTDEDGLKQRVCLTEQGIVR
jgi:hypothetical protein